jgi:hypothetical protein
MKTLKLIAVGIILLVSSTSQAQVSVSLNIGTAPSWAPRGYANVEYYYLPDIEAYYDVRASQYIYFGGGIWNRSRYLPVRYRNYDLDHCHKVVLGDYHGNRPYMYFKQHKTKYYREYRDDYRRNDDRRYTDNRYNDNRYSDRYYKNDKKHRYADNDRYSHNRREYDSRRHDRD